MAPVRFATEDFDMDSDLYCTEKPLTSSPAVRYIDTSRTKRRSPLYEIYLGEPAKDVAAAKDKLLFDVRVVKTLVKTENNYKYPLSNSYLFSNECPINSSHRKILLTWMYEVVSDQNVDEIIFLQAVNYVDRFMSNTRIEKTKLQLLGCAAMLLASKVRNNLIIGASTLSYLTEGSCTEKEIIEFEIYLLARLNWDINAVLGTDFLEPVITQTRLHHLDFVKKHSTAFLCMMSLYGVSLNFNPSTLAASCIYTALTYTDRYYKAEVDRLVTFLNVSIGIHISQLVKMRDIVVRTMDYEVEINKTNYDSPEEEDNDSGIGSSTSSSSESENLIESFEELNNLHIDKNTEYVDDLLLDMPMPVDYVAPYADLGFGDDNNLDNKMDSS